MNSKVTKVNISEGNQVNTLNFTQLYLVINIFPSPLFVISG